MKPSAPNELINNNSLFKKSKTLNHALYEAAEKGDAAQILSLLEQDTDIHFISSSGQTALAIASINGHTETVKLLLGKGANAKYKDNQGRTSLIHACRHGHSETAVVLLDYDSSIINEVDENNESALMMASTKDLAEIVKLLLAKGADAKQVSTSDGCTALGYAFLFSSNIQKTFEILFEHDPSLMNDVLEDMDKEDALAIALEKGLAKIVKMLFEQGIDAQYKDSEDNTNLMIACTDGYIETVAVLLDYDSSIINEVNDDNDSALTLASQGGYTEIVKLLLSNGANTKQKNNNSQTSLILACENGDTETVAALLAYDSSIINEMCDDGFSALTIAIYYNHPATVELLLKNNANIKQLYGEGFTTLMLASNKGFKEIVNLLIKYDPSLIKVGKDGCTPLVAASSKGHTEIVDILLSHGLNSDLEMALTFAIDANHQKVVVLLKDAMMLRDFIKDEVIEVYKSKLPINKLCRLTEFGLSEATNVLFKKLYSHMNVLKPCLSNNLQRREITNQLAQSLISKDSAIMLEHVIDSIVQNCKGQVTYTVGFNLAKERQLKSDSESCDFEILNLKTKLG